MKRWFTLLAILLTTQAYAYKPAISIIIDDLGNNLHAGMDIVKLPGPVVCAILPRRPFSKVLAKRAHKRGKEVMLHTPMQAQAPLDLGFGGLYVKMNRQQILKTFRTDLASIPFVEGINNHMGSLFTQSKMGMRTVLKEAKRRHLFYVDSRTTKYTVAEKTAKRLGVATTRRNVFLDDSSKPALIRAEFRRLIRLARKYGSAVAIGHPHPNTIKVLQQELPKLKKYGVRLLGVKALIQRQSLAKARLPKLRIGPKAKAQIPAIPEYTPTAFDHAGAAFVKALLGLMLSSGESR